VLLAAAPWLLCRVCRWLARSTCWLASRCNDLRFITGTFLLAIALRFIPGTFSLVCDNTQHDTFNDI
jgi:hypothetical protein